MDRRSFLKSGLVATVAVTTLGSEIWRRALASHPPPVIGTGPYGPLGAADANGIRLPAGFTSRALAQSGLPVPGTLYPWHHVPDGAATFATPDGRWIYVCNSEAPGILGGGASAIRFATDGSIDGPLGAYRILGGTNINCAGGPTPWGTWLSCEEYEAGLVWECDPTGVLPGIPRPGLGTFSHEAAAVDPILGHVYLTEDESDGRFYRFTPSIAGDLSAGLLEVARVDSLGGVDWLEVPDPNSVSPPTRSQVPESTPFRGGEGAWFDSVARTVYFTTKGDDRIWAYAVDAAAIEVYFDSRATSSSPLNGVDNITVSPGREIFVCEDHSSAPHQMVMLSPDPGGGPVVVSTFFELIGHANSELTGVCFNPAGDRMYFSSQRGTINVNVAGLGITYEITGPFNH
jgi:secreted PhoX family phosphatase